VQYCTRCNTHSPDSALNCENCGVDLNEFAKTAVTLRKFQENPRVFAVHLIVHEDACPACQELAGTYPKDQVPKLPMIGCSHPEGCRCFYQPLLEEIFP